MTRVRYLSSYLDWVSHQDFKNIAYVGFFRHFVCVFVFVVVFVIVFVFVFVSCYDFWTTFIISFHNMYGYRGLWSLWAEIMIIFEVMTDIHTHTHTPIPLIERVKMSKEVFQMKCRVVKPKWRARTESWCHKISFDCVLCLHFSLCCGSSSAVLSFLFYKAIRRYTYQVGAITIKLFSDEEQRSGLQGGEVSCPTDFEKCYAHFCRRQLSRNVVRIRVTVNSPPLASVRWNRVEKEWRRRWVETPGRGSRWWRVGSTTRLASLRERWGRRRWKSSGKLWFLTLFFDFPRRKTAVAKHSKKSLLKKVL